MRVTCVANKGDQLCESYRKHGYHNKYEFPVMIGQNYIVYGIVLQANHIWYLTLDQSDPFPEWMPAELFQITDSKLSRHWYCGANFDGLDNTIDFVWGYKELADYSPHFDLLVDRDEEALKIFTLRRGAMDLEFPDPTVSCIAEILDQDWLLCPQCGDAWKSHSLDGMVKCEVCGIVMQNPRYNITVAQSGAI